MAATTEKLLKKTPGIIAGGYPVLMGLSHDGVEYAPGDSIDADLITPKQAQDLIAIEVIGDLIEASAE